ncbi:MAG: polysaccharide biosynthesis protein, partial [Acidimicrobiaceae bacterium]|nr:polysaccharide biosynthesis protein [Acidimicrobiaceae bacterium]
SLLVGGRSGAHALALYAAATSTAAFAMFPMIAVGASTVPSFSRWWQSGDRSALNDLAQRAVRWAFWPQLAITLLLAVAGRQLLGWFGPGFRNAWPALLLLLVGQLANTATGYIGCLMKLSGHQRQSVQAIVVFAAANVMLVLLGIHLGGITGAAAGTALSALCWNVWLYRLVRRHVGVFPGIFDVLLGRSPARQLDDEGTPSWRLAASPEAA